MTSTSATTFLDKDDRIVVGQADPETVWLVVGPDVTAHIPNDGEARKALALDLYRAGSHLLDLVETAVQSEAPQKAKDDLAAALDALPF